MSVSATERAIMRLTLTQMLRRRMLYSTRVAASQMGCTLLPVASPYLTKFLKKAVVRGSMHPPVSNDSGTHLPTGMSKDE